MAKMCNDEETEDLNKTITNFDNVLVTAKTVSESHSPVFKCCNPKTRSCSSSSEYDIPSYQINQSPKSKASSKFESESKDWSLPFSPVFSPFTTSSNHFQTSSKYLNEENSCKNNKQCDNNKEPKPKCNIFESLGMTDKDISWVSSMASPPPLQIPGTSYNTIEKATFLPEEKFQCIQPRALFSPTLDEDFGCQPLIFSSESEDDEAYKSNIRLSDVCATLKELEVKSLEMTRNSTEDLEIKATPEQTLLSPVITTKKSKSELKKRKSKGNLVKSPELKYEFLVDQDLKTEKLNNTKFSSESSSSIQNFVEDDSFQSISFTCIDELCKTLVNVTEQSDSFKTLKSDISDIDCEKTITALIKSKNDSSNNLILNYFYKSKTKSGVYSVSEMDDIHLYAKALEEVDVNIPEGKKLDQSFADKGIVSLAALSKQSPKINTVKRLHSELSEEKNHNNEKVLKKANLESSNWDEMKEYLTESQLNVNENEIFKTVEDLEKNLATHEDIDQKDYKKIEQNQREGSEEMEKADNCLSIPKSSLNTFHDKSLNDLYKFDEKCTFSFTTAQGNKIQVGEEALKKAKNIFKECDENSENVFIAPNNKKKFSHCKTIKVSSAALEKAKTLMNFENQSILSSETEVSLKFLDIAKHMDKNTTQKNFCKPIKVSPEALEKGKVVMLNENTCKNSGKIIKVSPESLEKAKAIMFDESPSILDSFSGKNFCSGSGKKIQVSNKALEKAKALMSEEDSYQLNSVFMKGFSTGTGKKIQVSNEALEKAKALMNEEDSYELNSVFMKGFSTGTGKKIQVSNEALEKAKALLASCEEKPEEELEKASFTTYLKKLEDDPNKKSTFPKLDKLPLQQRNLSSDNNQAKSCTSKNNLEGEMFSEKGNKNKDSSFVTEEFSIALGNKVKASNEVLKRAKTLLSACNENIENNCVNADSSKNIFTTFSEPPDGPKIGFSTASGVKVNVSKEALAKAKERAVQWELQQEHSNVSETIKSEQGSDFQNSKNWVSHNDEIDASVNINNRQKSFLKKPDRPDCTTNVNKTSPLENDEDEIIPSWLHVYNTSPSLVSDKKETSVSYQTDIENSTENSRDYINRSPVLGVRDRFYKKIKKKKLFFENELDEKISEKQGNNKRPSSSLSIDFSAPFKKLKYVKNDSEITSEEICLNLKKLRADARFKQEQKAKEKEKVKPLKGSHFSKKCSEKQKTWMEAVNNTFPEIYSKDFLKSFNVLDSVLNVNVENAEAFRFDGVEFFGATSMRKMEGISVGDGAFLIPDDDNKFGVDSFKRAFLASPGVQSNLVPKGWVENHYKWIVWKLAHYETSFPMFFGGRCLTLNNVMLQLKYRYDREIDRNERSALKKILERDDTSIKRIVLVVCGIKKIINNDSSDYQLCLTDGWYSCAARSDPAMKRLIEKGKLSIGIKLIIQGATLMNCDQGISPLEMSENVYLKISSNSTRRIRWDAKLGFQKNPESFTVSLGSILPQGGSISRLDLIIVRVYPMLYMEKTSDGHHVTRNLRSEEKAVAEYQKLQETKIEKIYKEVESEMQKSTGDGKSFQTELSQNERSFEEEDYKKNISNSLCSNLENYSIRQNDSFKKELCKKIEQKLAKEKLNTRNVSEFFRVRVVDLRKPDYNNSVLLTVWNPNEELIGFFSEGKAISVRNVGISNSSRNTKPMQINTNRQTQFKEMNRNVRYPARQLTRLNDVSSKLCPAFEEVDLVGIVAQVKDVSYGSRLAQIIYLTDVEFNFVGIVFWGHCKNYGWENVLTLHSIVACSNLQWKKNYTVQEIPSIHASEYSVFTENPKHPHLKEELEKLKKTLPKDKNTFFAKCEEELTRKLDESKWQAKRQYHQEASSKLYPPSGFESRPTASSTPIKPFSVGGTSGEAEPSPIYKRIEKLQSYGEPPPLMHLDIRNAVGKPRKKK